MTATTPPAIPAEKRRANAACAVCSHVWTVAWLPMAMDMVATCYSRACCPMCGSILNYVAPADAVSEQVR